MSNSVVELLGVRGGGGGDEEIGFSFIEKVRERRRICRGSIGLEKIAHIVAKRIRQKGEGKIDRTFRAFPREEVALFSCSMMLALQAPYLILPGASDTWSGTNLSNIFSDGRELSLRSHTEM